MLFYVIEKFSTRKQMAATGPGVAGSEPPRDNQSGKEGE
jgi:hypothetical protein